MAECGESLRRMLASDRLPPLLIQAGSDERLLDDAIRLAGVAASADVRTTARDAWLNAADWSKLMSDSDQADCKTNNEQERSAL